MRRRGFCACFSTALFPGLILFAAAVVVADDGAKAKPVKLPPAAKRQVDYLKDIKPILARACYECHGADDREAGLALHAKAGALAGGDSGPSIVAGKSAESRLILFVTGQNKDGLRMPPEGEGERLSDDQIGLLRAWIDQGAKWPDEGDAASVAKSDHWAFQPIRRPQPPAVRNERWVRNPIDRFVLARLEREGLAPSPEADRHTLIRRAALDLTGLPPSPEQLSRFLNDTSPEAYERLIDRLLASPHYGERWARHWLDLARYADSDGYEKDRPRPYAWRYREWVIRALNRDLPFDEFTVEQLAGDLLPNATTEQKVATGFHRNTLTNLEGGVDREEDRVKQTIDRANTTGAVWLGLTVGCAQCHSHKYDPISQREYYQFYAFFNSLQEVNVPAPLTHEDDAEFQQATARHAQRLAKLKAAVAAYVKQRLPAQQAAWEKTAAGRTAVWQTLAPGEARSAGGATLTVQKDGSVLAAGKNPAEDTYTLVLTTTAPGVTAIRLEVLADPSLPANGPGRVKHGNFVLSEISLQAGPADGASQPSAVALRNATADYSQGEGKNGWPVAAAIDGKPETGWAIAPQFGKDHVAVFETAKPIAFEGGARLVLTLDQRHGTQHTIGRFRVSVTTHEPPIPAGGLPDAVAQALAAPAEQRTPAQRAALANYYRSIDPELKKLNAAVAAEKPPERKDQTMAPVLADMAKPRETHVLIRGDFLRPAPRFAPPRRRCCRS